jgi:hypothetical protein
LEPAPSALNQAVILPAVKAAPETVNKSLRYLFTSAANGTRKTEYPSVKEDTLSPETLWVVAVKPVFGVAASPS